MNSAEFVALRDLCGFGYNIKGNCGVRCCCWSNGIRARHESERSTRAYGPRLRGQTRTCEPMRSSARLALVRSGSAPIDVGVCDTRADHAAHTLTTAGDMPPATAEVTPPPPEPRRSDLGETPESRGPVDLEDGFGHGGGGAEMSATGTGRGDARIGRSRRWIWPRRRRS